MWDYERVTHLRMLADVDIIMRFMQLRDGKGARDAKSLDFSSL